MDECIWGTCASQTTLSPPLTFSDKIDKKTVQELSAPHCEYSVWVYIHGLYSVWKKTQGSGVSLSQDGLNTGTDVLDLPEVASYQPPVVRLRLISGLELDLIVRNY